MTSPFAAALAQMDTVLDQHMGETIQITPMRSGDFAAVPDPDRPAFDVVALVNEQDPSTADVGKMDARFAYEETEAEIRRAALPAGTKLRKNDEVLLIDRPNAPRFKIARVDDTDRERIGLTLTRLGAE